MAQRYPYPFGHPMPPKKPFSTLDLVRGHGHQRLRRHARQAGLVIFAVGMVIGGFVLNAGVGG
jgi:hypothetical protein